MKLLVIGGGGREHALAWRLAQSSRVEQVYVAPGNGGTAIEPKLENLPLTQADELAAFVLNEGIAFTVVGPEAPLAAGVVDVFRAAGLKIFGPTKAAAQLESSKDYAKAFMVRHGISTAHYQTFTDAQAARAYVSQQGAPIVVKADGLAAGKGVVVATSVQEAHDAIDAMIGDNGPAGGGRVVIEECLQGEEASFIVMCDDQQALPLASSQDHKRLLDGDQGPNTGGMGAYSPAPIVTPVLHERIMREVIQPTLKGMAQEGHPYTGFLYAGVMIGPGPDESRVIKVLEFNCRMGDPETQPILLRVDSDFSTVLEHAVNGTLSQAQIDWNPRTALGVVMAAANYPGTPRTGDAITNLPAPRPDCVVFHAGTTLDGGTVRTSGGRVLCVTALADTVEQARATAYQAIQTIHFDGAQYRKDIAWRALAPNATD
ncbi:phosphoribosylamine--glycine ligase [Pusillimonas sp. CC-YST705]|uniref:Phosphoribosylamine--glycine ligase n=1 Tax=Mesopusillimonas faecipullorum TaxID=2755040 RepID=A0ABS8CAI9_9BURK|nr:phosphoribosylamine--glycine ligase [Mesopusillimonas faecipullorum]MCB5362854.1 phosphoribosylamine--glycine ligase [Mesopusillimonas faecipullorum]